MELRLNSPVGGLPAIYRWPLNNKKGYDEAKEIIETIIWGCKDIPDLCIPLKKNILKDVDVNSFESMKALSKRYNKAINNVLSLEKGTQKFCDRLNQVASKELLHHVLQQTYSAAVTNAEQLNKYQAFSPDVYGETSFDLISQMVNQIKLTKKDVFVDLGSGVGQVILQVAATSLCKSCIGIERADVPAKYAEAMQEKFRFWMQWYGKSCGNFYLIKGDFFDEIHREKFSQATVIFVNNFAFGPSVDHKLKERFAELKHGTRIVSSKSFCPLNFRISDRNLSDIGTIMDISEIAPNQSSVSWTDKPVSYYLQVIDRTKLEKYFQAKKNGKLPTPPPEDVDTSCDSFETENNKNFIIEQPKKRGRKPKPRNESSTSSPVNLPNSLKRTNNIIRPSKLILNKSNKLTHEDENRLTKRKRKEISRSLSPEIICTNWNSQGRLKTYSRKSIEASLPTPLLSMALSGNLKKVMDTFKIQYIQMVEQMADPLYKIKIRRQIEEEIKRHRYLKLRMMEVNEEIEDVVVSMQNKVLRAALK